MVINGDDRDEVSSNLVERFRVDGIPHLALISKDGEVKTALIGRWAGGWVDWKDVLSVHKGFIVFSFTLSTTHPPITIGKIPKQVLEADLDSLVAGKSLPYEGYDAFEDEDHFVKF